MKTFAQLVDDLSRAIEQLPGRIATLAVNFSKNRFVKQNWHDTHAEPWQKRSARRRGGQARQKGAVLVDSGRLKRSIRIVSVSQQNIVIGTDVPYAEVHNDGFDGVQTVRQHNRRSRKGRTCNVKSHTRRTKMPQRRFIGESAELNRQMENMIVSEFKNAIEK